MPRAETDRKKLTRLRQLLVKRFSLAELKVLAFDVGVEYDDLEGTTKATKMQDLILFLQRRDELGVLLQTVTELRPHADWPDFEVSRGELATGPSALTDDTYTHEKTGLIMVRVSAGEFIYQDNRLQYLPEFWISKTPLTNRHYMRFVSATGHDPPLHWQGKAPPVDIAEHPVVNVTWYDATAYCKWADLRLPTMDEWEKAARGTDGREYPWGSEEPTIELCNFESNVGTTTPVGKYSPQGDSPYGCVDMAGNVWEWTGSRTDAEPARRFVSGGAFSNRSVRAAFRNLYFPDVRLDDIGFRVVKHLSDAIS